MKTNDGDRTYNHICALAMPIDIHTLANLMSLTNFMQVMALFVQYRVDKTHSGPGWWTLGMSFISGGFAFNYLRDNPAVGHAAVMANIISFTAGVTLLYVGVLRFLELKERRGVLLAVNALNAASFFYFSYFNDQWAVRRAIFGLVVGALALLIARALWTQELPSVTPSRYFLAAVFLLETLLLFANALNPSPPYTGRVLFTASVIQLTVYLGSLITSTLWTYGFILMVNQRLVTERLQTIGKLQDALDQIKTLTGILPICAHCKKIRGDEGYWEQVDSFMSKHTEVEFSHGICPGCMAAHFPSQASAIAFDQ